MVGLLWRKSKIEQQKTSQKRGFKLLISAMTIF